MGDFLGQTASTGLGLFSGIFLVLGIVALVAGIYLYFVGRNQWRGNRLQFRLGTSWGIVGMILGALTVLFILFRLIGIDGLNVRFWLYFVGVLWAVALGYGAYYFSTRYRVELAASQRTQRGGRPAQARQRGGATNTPATALPERPKGTAGNPRGTSERGDRRREKR